MNDIQRSELIEILNKPKCYSDSLREWLDKNSVSFAKEDNQIFEHVDTTQSSILFGEKLHVLFELLPEADYMYYFNDTDCLLSRIIKNKSYDVIIEVIKSPAKNHNEILIEEKLLNSNSFDENIIHVLLKNVKDEKDFLYVLVVVSQIKMKTENFPNFWLKKDNTEKDLIDYIVLNIKNDYGVFNNHVFYMLWELIISGRELFKEKNGFEVPETGDLDSIIDIKEKVL